MSGYEYRTTTGWGERRVYDSDGTIIETTPPDDPLPPRGDRWELLAVAVTTHNRLHWTWRRASASRKKAK